MQHWFRRVSVSIWACVAYTSASFCVCLGLSADEGPWKLQPLKYNHPGLEVDLGVGLWAFPLPLDYDGDGDMDLLVSCPDKPTNGTYWFENPTQDAEIQMPVFKAGVRIGNGYQYMMLSEFAGDSVVLKPGQEYRRDPNSGRFDFGKPLRIESHPNPNRNSKGRTRGNMWRYVDFDGDGDRDIIAGTGDWTDYGWDHAYDHYGKWKNGRLHGYIYLIDNEGTDEDPVYGEQPQRLRAGGGEIDVYGWPSPNFAEFDGEGDLDLLCGEFLDGFTYFQNTGSRTQPIYASGTRLKNPTGDPLTMHVQMITPTAIDWDRDGDLDLIVGDEDGRVALVENTGILRDRQPVFRAPKYFRQQADTLKFGALATPYAYDWDRDGDEDIVCGNTAGSIGWFQNLGASPTGLPKWDEPRLLEVDAHDGGTKPFRVMAGENGSIQGPCEAKWGYTTLSVADWDNDGDGDILFNSIHAKLGLLRNENGMLVEQPFDTGLSERPPAWYGWQAPSSATLTQWRTTPLAIDFDGDNSLDLVLLDQEGFLTLRRSGKTAERIFVDEQNQPLRFNAATCGGSGRIKLAIVDWDGDARLDVLTNSENATWYRNRETRDGKFVLKKMGNLARRNVAGHTSSPAVCDFDRDGAPDLLVGSENGSIYHIAHADCVQFSSVETDVSRPVTVDVEQISGIVREEFVFAKAPFQECHASTICQTSRGLVTAWFGGSEEGKPDVGIWSSYHDGVKWSDPILVADGVQHEELRHPCWNPVLYQPPGDTPTLLFFKVGPRPNAWWGEMLISYDRGRTFVDRRRLPEGIDGPVRAKPILLPDRKTLLCGSSTEDDGWRVHFELVRIVDGLPVGTWERIGPIHQASEFNAIQPTFLTHPNGKIQALCRTKDRVIATSHSSDSGKTWSPMQATNLPNPNSAIESLTIEDGRHLLVYNPMIAGKSNWASRAELRLAMSTDGVNWTQAGDLEREEKGEFSYPAMIQTSDGLVHISYTWNRTKIKHVVIDPRSLSAVDEND